MMKGIGEILIQEMKEKDLKTEEICKTKEEMILTTNIRIMIDKGIILIKEDNQIIIIKEEMICIRITIDLIMEETLIKEIILTIRIKGILKIRIIIIKGIMKKIIIGETRGTDMIDKIEIFQKEMKETFREIKIMIKNI